MKDELNTICTTCTRSDCEGTTCKTWTGCIYRETLKNAPEVLQTIADNLQKLTVYEEISNRAEEAWTADPENTEKERAFDTAYNREFTTYTTTAGLLAELLKIEEKTARMMITTKRREVMQILARRATA